MNGMTELHNPRKFGGYWNDGTSQPSTPCMSSSVILARILGHVECTFRLQFY